MDNLRVLQIGKYYYPYRGGFESSLYTLVNELKDNLQIQVLVSHTRRSTVVEQDNGLRIIRLANLGKIFSQTLTPSLPIWIRYTRSDIIHLHLPNPLAMISYLLVSPPGRLIVSYHSDIVRQKIAMIFLRPLLIKLLHKAESIVVTSENLIDNSPFLRRFQKKCHVIPHGIDIDRFKATSQVLEDSGKIKNSINKPIILFVGRLVYYKGLKYLIRAMKDIDARLIIIGNGPCRFKLRLTAKCLGVNNKILWLGNVSDGLLPAYYYACDLFVLPSCVSSESFGLVILEAHACGKPVVSTDLPTGVTFTNLHQKTGLVVPPKDISALRDAINLLLRNPGLRQGYGQNGRERAGSEFTKELMAERILRVYNGGLT